MKGKWLILAALGIFSIVTVLTFASKQAWSSGGKVEAISLQSEEKQSNNNSATPQENRVNNNNPDEIPSRAAYILLFRFFAKYDNGGAKNHARSYLRHIGLGKQPKNACPDTTSYASTGINDQDIDSVIEVAHIFNQKVAVLDTKADAIKDKTFPNPNAAAMSELTTLQREKEILTDETIVLLRSKLSQSAFSRIENHIQNRVKRLTKKVASPPNPLSPVWRDSSAHNHH
jgi:hypothetical protein